MSTKSNDSTDDEPAENYVEIGETTVTRRGGRIRSITVAIRYYGGQGGYDDANEVRFGVDEHGTASLSSLEHGLTDLRGLRLIPAAAAVARTVPGVNRVVDLSQTIEAEIAAGEGAIDRRLEMDNVPEDLRRGREQGD